MGIVATMTSLEAFAELLAVPDPPELHRGSRPVEYPDHLRSMEDRRRLVLRPLLHRWAQQRHFEVDPEPMVRPAQSWRVVERKRA